MGASYARATRPRRKAARRASCAPWRQKLLSFPHLVESAASLSRYPTAPWDRTRTVGESSSAVAAATGISSCRSPRSARASGITARHRLRTSMATVSAPDVLQNLTAYNYGICFLDLLGQRAVFRGEGWLPPASGDEEKKIFFEAKLKPTVGAVMALQRRAYNMIASVVEPRDDAPFRKQLAPEQRPVWDAMHRTKIKTQHWSDGLISYAALGDPDIKCRMNAMYGLVDMAGAAMLQGLAMRQPVRGAIDGAWAMEIRDGELYGPAIDNAYELESPVSEW